MRKIKRLIALLLAAALCLSLAGCRELDEAKANHAFWNPDGSIQWGNYTYKALPECDEFNPQTADRPTVWVTEPDVPVLLRDMFGRWMDRSEDDVFLWLESGTIYCRADKHADLVRRIEEGYKHEGYAYYYWTYDEKIEEYRDFVYRLNTNQEKTLDTVLTTVTPLSLPKNASMVYEYSVTIFSTSDDLLFRREGYDISYSDGTYYVVDYLAQDTAVYEVPSLYNAVFDAIVKTYLEAEGYDLGDITQNSYDGDMDLDSL